MVIPGSSSFNTIDPKFKVPTLDIKIKRSRLAHDGVEQKIVKPCDAELYNQQVINCVYSVQRPTA